MATLFDTIYCGRPCLLIVVWILALLGTILLLLGMMVDELTVVSFSYFGDKKFTCQSLTYDYEPSILNEKYIDTDFPQFLLQKQAGQAWLAFGILACLFIPSLCFGIITDYYAGIFDHKKPVDYWQGCCMLQSWGFTKVSILFILILTLLQIIIYSIAQTCSKDEFLEEYLNIVSIEDNDDINDVSSVGGISFVMVVFCFLFLLFVPILILYYQYRISAELPTGEKKEAPVKFQMYPDGVERPKPKPKEPTPPPMGPTGQAPQSEYFQPSKNVTRNNSNATTATMMSEGDYSGSNKQYKTGGNNDRALSVLVGGDDGNKTKNKSGKPKGPPPKPKPKPSGPPPVPSDAIR